MSLADTPPLLTFIKAEPEFEVLLATALEPKGVFPEVLPENPWGKHFCDMYQGFRSPRPLPEVFPEVFPEIPRGVPQEPPPTSDRGALTKNHLTKDDDVCLNGYNPYCSG